MTCGLVHTVTLKQTQCRKKKKIAAAVYLYQADNGGEWGELRFVQGLPEARLLKSVVVPFGKGRA